MTAPLSHQALQDLLGAYALDAVVGDESEAVELHLRECPRCCATVAEFRETASLLALGHGPAPVHAWDAIVAQMEDSGPRELRVPAVTTLGHRRRRQLRVAVASAAALLLAALGLQIVHQGHEIKQMRVALADKTILSAALAAQGRPGGRRTDLRTSNGKLLARAVLEPDGTGYLWGDGLPRLGKNRSYQLWAVSGTEKISVGVLGGQPGVVPFRIAGDVIGLAVTDETAGGVVASQKQPTASGLVVRT
jgi:anti-sigma factor RsiW